MDGALAVDAEGRFVPTRDALDLFDHFLLASGERSEARILERIEAEIEARLSGPAAGDARALLRRYVAYRERTRELHASGAAPLGLERRLQWLRELRREVFGADLARTLFEEQEARDLWALERLRVLSDPGLDAAARRARLAALDERLPAPARTRRSRALAAVRLAHETSALRAAGADARELQRARERIVGAEAAERLATLDRARAAWRSRLAAYRRERDRLLTADPAPEPERLEALRAAHFAPDERARVRAFDRLDGLR